MLERGNIVQHGTHEALLKQGGAYATLWSAQQVLEHYGEEAAKMKKRSGFTVMARLIGLVKPLSGYMVLAILMGLVGHLCAAFITIFGGFAPNSEAADTFSKALGSRTVLSGSVSRGKNDPSQSLQMMERPLLTADELKSIPKGSFIVQKTGCHPMRTRLRLFLEWGITFERNTVWRNRWPEGSIMPIRMR